MRILGLCFRLWQIINCTSVQTKLALRWNWKLRCCSKREQANHHIVQEVVSIAGRSFVFARRVSQIGSSSWDHAVFSSFPFTGVLSMCTSHYMTFTCHPEHQPSPNHFLKDHASPHFILVSFRRQHSFKREIVCCWVENSCPLPAELFIKSCSFLRSILHAAEFRVWRMSLQPLQYTIVVGTAEVKNVCSVVCSFVFFFRLSWF